eukprot:TRINITY_DN16709_c0_g1_i1.p1 TRINITY_DN16709_c0_g1~~TRINITY_DN16709_c0_g1_i1.p1  ORF type:complete len:537 (+),score=95.63 TRINITY_DN16709_c0_g1_i1:67-1611(+)
MPAVPAGCIDVEVVEALPPGGDRPAGCCRVVRQESVPRGRVDSAAALGALMAGGGSPRVCYTDDEGDAVTVGAHPAELLEYLRLVDTGAVESPLRVVVPHGAASAAACEEDCAGGPSDRIRGSRPTSSGSPSASCTTSLAQSRWRGEAELTADELAMLGQAMDEAFFDDDLVASTRQPVSAAAAAQQGEAEVGPGASTREAGTVGGVSNRDDTAQEARARNTLQHCPPPLDFEGLARVHHPSGHQEPAQAPVVQPSSEGALGFFASLYGTVTSFFGYPPPAPAPAPAPPSPVPPPRAAAPAAAPAAGAAADPASAPPPALADPLPRASPRDGAQHSLRASALESVLLRQVPQPIAPSIREADGSESDVSDPDDGLDMYTATPPHSVANRARPVEALQLPGLAGPALTAASEAPRAEQPPQQVSIWDFESIASVDSFFQTEAGSTVRPRTRTRTRVPYSQPRGDEVDVGYPADAAFAQALRELREEGIAVDRNTRALLTLYQGDVAKVREAILGE